MSVHDKGYGVNAGLDFESDFTNRSRSANAPDVRGANAAPRREGPLMSGAGRPGQPYQGQPIPGQPGGQQRSIFGTGRGPVFAKMPAYTPVTRAPEPAAPRIPEPPRQDYSAYARPQTEPRPAPQSVSGYTNGTLPATYPSRGAPADYKAPPRETYQPQTYSNQGYAGPGQPSPARPEPAFPSQYSSDPYAGRGQQSQAPITPPPSAYRDTGFAPATSPNHSDPGFPDKIFPESTYSTDARFTETSYTDASMPEAGYAEPSVQGSKFAGQSYGNANFSDADYADASFPEPQDAGLGGDDLQQGGYAQRGMPPGEPEPLHLETPAGSYGAEPEYAGQAYGAPHAEMAQPLPSHQALQAFDAPYDQAPQIALGPTELPPQQNFYEGEQGDADFLDESQLAPADVAAAGQSRKFGMGRRSIVMVSSALLGAVALGGALAFAYKQSGGSVDGAPPLVQADSSPVKQAPADPGGKEFPNKNKLIYERLQNGDQPEAERIVPRQEELAMPAMPGGEQTAGLPAGAAPMAAPGVATVEDPAGGPRRVKTLVVRPDGSVETPPAGEAAPPMAQPSMPPAQQMAAAPGQDQMAAPAAPVPVTVPVPAAAPAADPQAVAAIPTPAAAPAPQAAPPSKFVVQVSSKQNQTEALATFADMQQKYPSLLGPYRPLVQKADLGTKGVWYRLQIGPMTSKTTASKLCEDLKSQGLPECLVVAAQ